MPGESTIGSRRSGVEFGELDGRLEGHAYPTTTEALLEAYGNEELVLQDGTTSLREVLAPLEGQSYASADDVRRSVLTFVDEGAIGRKHYSDRTPPVTGEDRPGTRLSF